MVVTRSQSKRGVDSSESPCCKKNNGNTSVNIDGETQNLYHERLGRGCRVSREPPASYDSMYVTAALLPPGRQRHDAGELKINSRYPERDAAKRAVIRMSSTLHSLDEESMQYWSLHDTGADDEEDKSTADDGSEGGVISSQSRGRKRNGNKTKRMACKRDREASIDSSITVESLREELHGQDKGGEEVLFEGRSSSLSSSTGYMSEEEVRRVCRNAKESTVKNVAINHYLHGVLQDSVEDSKRAKKRQGKSHRRRMEDLFLGFDDVNWGTECGDVQGKTETPVPLGDITPLHIDTSVSFERVGGLPGHVVMLREMVLLPLLYPEVLRAMNLTPPRGVLFVGPPGTGKTLMARALANEAANCAQRKITFFMRKGADILSKWVGESERQLSLLFGEARRRQPSIIFFDEIDGLVPVRHARTEQSQAALVSTLLALIDGLDDRGQVIVIGATNRPDTIDPALRRPGRLDRELYFPLPDAAARRHILSIVTQSMLPVGHPERNEILEELVARCEGWSGAEIQALCTEAGLNRLRTSLPQLYTTSRRLQVPTLALSIKKEDFFLAAHRIKSSVRRGVVSIANNLEEHLEHLLHSTRTQLISHVATIWPSAKMALACERRDCSDINNAVHELSSFSVPHTAQSMLLFLTMSSHKNACNNDAFEFALEKAAVALIKSLPSLRACTLHLPHLAVDHNSVPAMTTAMTNGASVGDTKDPEEYSGMENGCYVSGHIYSCIISLQRSSSPALVLLQGLDLWLEEYGISSSGIHSEDENDETDDYKAERKKHMDALCYYLNFLRNSDVLVIVPTIHTDICSRFFGGARLNTQLRTEVYRVPCAPTDDDLRSFIHYIFRVVSLALSHCVPVAWEELPDNLSAPPPLSMEEVSAVRRSTLDLWRRVEYRRRQLRHVLTKWVSQYLSSRKFSLFFSADLDLTPSHDLYEEWRRHTHGRRIGLCDVMEKLENEEYTCLSQYHDDIDMLVQNVRIFFRTRSTTDQRYRSRALELKEETVLNLYKINRKVVQFCERHKDLSEPDMSSSSASSHNNEGRLSPVTVTVTNTKKETTKTRRSRSSRRQYCGRRRRRRRIIRVTPRISTKDNLKVIKVEDGGDKVKDIDEEEEKEKEEKKGDEMVDAVASSVDVVSGNRKNADPSVASSTRNSKNVLSEQDGMSEMNAFVTMLRDFSFLQLHRVFQLAMSLLEEELSRRRKRHQSVSTSHSGEVSTEEINLFFQAMLKGAVQAFSE